MSKPDAAGLASLGSAESEILDIVWKLKEATVQQIWAELPPNRQIASVTVQTVLRRLLAKGYVRRRVIGKAHVFSSFVKREKVITKNVGDLVTRFFGGDAVSLVVHLAKSRQIDQEDIKRLQDILKETRPKAYD